jgi:hypothetical protein
VTNHTFNFPMIGGDSKSRVFSSPLPYLWICQSAHTHMHIILQYVHITHTINSEILSSLMGVGVESLQRFSGVDNPHGNMQ